jgi:hypothetical protein
MLELEQLKKELETGTNEQISKEEFFKKSLITLKSNIPAIKPSIYIDGSIVCTEGGFLIVSGQKKAGKSHGIINILATALMKEVDTSETLLIRANYVEKKQIVYVDTEQHPSTSQDFIKKIMRIANLQNEPKNLQVFNLTPFADYKEKWRIIKDYLLTIENLGLLVIDGVADIVKSVNDEETAKEIVDTLLSIIGTASVVVTIHEGKDNNGATGHLGQIFEKKCTGTVAFFKDRKKQVHTIKSKLVRHDKDFEDIYFRWKDEKKRFGLLDETEKTVLNEKNEETKAKELILLIKKIYGQNRKLSKDNLKAGFKTHDSKLDLTIKESSISTNINRKIKQCLEFNILELDKENFYSLLID